LEDSTSTLWRSQSIFAGSTAFVGLQSIGSREYVANIRPGISHGLRVIYRVHTNLKLRLILFPALRTNFDGNLLCLDGQFSKFFKLVPLTTPITLSNCIFA
jgi:hypothetical protein